MFDGGRLPTPGVIDQQFGIDAEDFVEGCFLVFVKRSSRYITHRVKSELFQLPAVAVAHTPEISKRTVTPQQFPVFHFVQLRNPHAVLVRRNVLCHDVHCHLRKIQVRPDTGGRRNAGGVKHLPDHRHSKLVRRQPIGVKIMRRVNKNLVNRIDVNVLRRDVF